MNPIEIISLSKTYRGKRKQFVKALIELNLAVAEGEVFGFLGPNGAGKSTTIKTLVGQISPSSGAALLFGEPTGPPAARQNIGYLPENPAFYDFLTALEYLELVGRVFGMQKSTIRLESERVLELFGLAEAAKRPIKGYSKGMVQRLGLAQALLHDPDLYILDEPMSGLDPVGRAMVKQIMIDLKGKGKTIFFSTHVIADVEAVCDRVGIIARGQLKAENSVEEILEQGIEGYSIRLVESAPDEFKKYLAEGAMVDQRELYVTRKDFTHVIGQLETYRCQVINVEPNRRSLEDFFLKVIDSPESL